MKKTIYLIIISVIAILCIIAGTIKHLGNVNFGNGFPWGFPWGLFNVSDEDDNNAENISETVELNDFDKIYMDLSIMDVTVVTGDKASIHYECNRKKLVPEISVNDKELIVKQKNSKSNNGFVNLKCKMTLTVPKGVDYSKVVIDSNVGDIKVSDLSGDSISVDTDTGDLDIMGCTFDDLTIDSAIGDVKIEDSYFHKSEIDNDTGDVKITDCDFDGDMTIGNNTGDIEISGSRDINLFETDFSTDIGEVEVYGKEYKRHYEGDAGLSSQSDGNPKMRISTDIGDVKIRN